ncbi:MAG: phosphatidylcholine/phosphatidylserine synthase [Victivallaceae bacterium]
MTTKSRLHIKTRGKRVYLAPNVITAFALCCGLFIIFKSMLKEPNRDLCHVLRGLSILLLIAMVADFADGAVARIMKAESAFGGQFDSLSDSITFGVAPSLITIKSLSDFQFARPFNSLLLISAMIYSLCGVLRLVRYNIRSLKCDAGDSSEKSGYFTGLPIPAAGSAVVSATLLLSSNYGEYLSPKIKLFSLCSILIVIGGLMVSRWKFPNLKNLHFKIRSFSFVLILGIIAGIFFLGIIDYFIEMFFLVSWSYIGVVFPAFLLFRSNIDTSSPED